MLLIVVGSILYALSVVLFIDPIHVIPGSVTGIAVITKALFNTPIGVVNLVINIPLILVAVFYLGKKLLIYTVITIFLTSVLMDWWAFPSGFHHRHDARLGFLARRHGHRPRDDTQGPALRPAAPQLSAASLSESTPISR